MSTPFALNLAAAPLVSGLPVAPQALSMGAIDPPALSELVSRSATFESKPIANPEGARKGPPNERPKIRNDIVVIQIWTAPSKTIPKGKLECSVKGEKDRLPAALPDENGKHPHPRAAPPTDETRGRRSRCSAIQTPRQVLQLVLALVSAVVIATRAHPLPPTATNPALPLPTRRRARPHLADSWQDGWSETSGSGLVQLVILVFGL